MFKKHVFYFLLISLIGSNFSFAQSTTISPDGILFQAVARDANGNAAISRTVYAKVTILKSTATGTVDYAESFQVTSSAEGIFTIVIGKGARTAGASGLAAIDWANFTHFLNLQVAIAPTVPDPNWVADNQYVDLGTSQFWSVPYTLFASKAKVADSALNIGSIIVPSEKGGTGFNNNGKTISIANNIITKGVGDLTITTTAASNIIFPTSGTLATLAGTETLTNKTLTSPLLVGRPLTITQDTATADSTIASTLFVSKKINALALTSGAKLNISDTAAMLSTYATLAGTQSLTNKTINGLTPTALTNGFSIAGGTSSRTTLTVAGTANVSGINTGDQTIALTGDVTGTGSGTFSTTVNSVGGVSAANIATINTTVGNATSTNTNSTLVRRDASGNFSANIISATLSGTATNVSGIVAGANGGTGIANTGKTITLGGNITTANSFTTTGNAITLTSTGATNITLPTTGTIATLSGTETLTNKNINAGTNTISGLTNANLSGTAGIVDANLATIATAGKVANTATTATDVNTPNTIVKRDGTGNFSAGNITANLTGNVTGNATTATTLAASKNIYGNAFDGSANLTQVIAPAFGGTGIDNTGKTITLGGNISTGGNLTTGANNVTLNTTGATTVTLPLAGTLATIAGAETLSNKTIASPSLTGVPTTPTAAAGTNTTQVASTAFVTNSINTAATPDATTSVKGKVQLAGDLSGTAVAPTVATVGGSTATDINTATLLANAATDVNTSSTIVKRDGTGNFSAGNITANLTGNVTGNATTATTLAASKNIYGNAFDGSANLTQVIAPSFGGTGVDNTGKTITLGGNISTGGNLTTGANNVTLNTTGATTVTLPLAGTLATLAGTETLTNKTIASPSLTGVPTAPTAAAGTNTLQVASTAFVTTAVSSATPDASTTVKGKVQLTNDLGGTATAPVVNSVGGISSSTITTLPTLIAANTTSITAEITRATTAEITLQTNIDAEATRATTAEATNTASITAETTRAIAAEATLQTNINSTNASLTAEVTRATAAETLLSTRITSATTSITAEVTRATAAETALQTNINSTNASLTAEVTRATAAETVLSTRITAATTSLTAEVTRATAAETTLQTNINSTNASLTAEVTRATTAEAANTASITAETTRATAAETLLSTRITSATTSITAEVTRATSAETTLQTNINATNASLTAETTRATTAEAANTASITAETTRATAAETLLSTRITSATTSITAEVTRATAAENTLQTNINSTNASLTAEVTRATTAEAANTASITAETTRATAAETALSTRITSNTNSITINTSDIALRATIASPSFTGTPTAPTATLGDNTTQIATTAFVTASTAAATPDATLTIKGKLQLANDLGGTASAPVVNSVGGVSSATISTLPTLIAANTSSITAEITRATAAENNLSTRITSATTSITAEVTRATAAEATLQSNINSTNASLTSETTRATAAEATLQSNINSTNASLTSETNRATTAENTLQTNINSTNASLTSETTRAIAAEATLQTNINSTNASLTAETTRATTAETTLQSNINSTNASLTAETSRATTAENNLSTRITSATTSLTAEVTRATAAETTLQSNINSTNASLTAETTRATTAETTLQSNINAANASLTAETTRATTAETTLQSNINAANASLTAEVTRATVAENNLSTRITANTVSITANIADIALRATIASPSFTGTPTAPTPTTGDNSTQLATTAFVTATTAAATPDATSSQKGKLQLAGDLGGSATSPSVVTVGGSTASNINAATILANNATANNNASQIVKRNASGDFTAGVITADLLGTATNVTGVVLGANGGTGIANTGKTITLGGNVNTGAAFTTTGTTGAGNAADITLKTTGATELILPATGTLATLAGTEALTNKTINGITPTTAANGFTLSGGTASKTLTVNNNATLSGNNTGDQTITLTGDLTGTGAGTFSTTLASSGVTAGSYGSATTVPTFTVDAKGRVTNVANTTITGVSPAGSAMSSGKIVVGDAGNLASIVDMSGDVTIDNIGVTTIGANKITTSKILNSNITYAKIQDVTTGKVLGRVSTGNGIVEEIATTGTGSVVRSASPTFTGAPQVPTALVNSNDGTVANTEYVTRAIGNISASSVSGVLPGSNGGTGVDNTGKTITLAGSLITSGTNTLTFTTTGPTNVTVPTSGTLATTADLASIAGGNFSGSQITGIVLGANGGTGIDNTGKTITLGGNITTGAAFTTTGTTGSGNAAAITLKTTAATNLTLPTTGTIATLAGTESLTNKTIDAANNNISGLTNANLSGTAGITDANLATITTAGKVANTATTGTSSNTANAIVARDASGNFTASTITATLNGNAATTTKLATARTIYGNSFDGTANLGQIIASTFGGTGNGFTKFTGATSSEKVYTLPDANTTILTTNDLVTTAQGGTGTTTAAANTFFAGPSSGSNAAPAFRALTSSDLPSGSGSYIANSTTQQVSSNFNISADGVVGGSLTAGTLIKQGGTSSQFLKADGSVDSRSFATLTGNEALTNKTINGLTPTALATGFTIAGGSTTSKTLTVGNNANVAGTNTGDVSIAGENYLSLTNQTLTANAVDLSGTNVTGILAAARFPAMTGDVTNTAGTVATLIANNAITSTKIADNAVTSTKIADNAVASSKIATSAVTLDKIASISTQKLLGNKSNSAAGAPGEISIGSGLSLNASTGELSASGTGGTVTTVNALTLNATGNTLTSTVTTASSTPVISLTIPLASVTGTTAGLLSKADYDIFNAKQSALTLGTGVQTFLATPTSANLATAVTNEIGTGRLVFATGPSLTSAIINGLKIKSDPNHNIGFTDETGVDVLSQSAIPSGYHNIAMGANAMGAVYLSDITGWHNIAIGNDAGGRNASGMGNVYIGKSTGMSNYSGGYNTFIGYEADADVDNPNPLYTNATAIGNGAKVTGSNKIQLGDANITNVKTNGSITAGSVTYPNTHNGITNQVLSINASGTASFTTLGAAGASLTNGKILVGNASNVGAEVTMSGDVAMTNAGVVNINAGVITTTDLSNSAVTYAKMQNVSATNTLLGRTSAGAGIIEEIPMAGSGNVSRAIATIVAAGALTLSDANSGQIIYTQNSGRPAFPEDLSDGFNCTIVNYSNSPAPSNTLTTARFFTNNTGNAGTTSFTIPAGGSVNVSVVTAGGVKRYYINAGDVTVSAGTGLTNTGGVLSVNTSQSIATLSNLTTNGIVTTSGGTGALSVVSSLPVAQGGTGQTTYTDGQLLIGNTSGNTLTKATLTAGSGVSITNGNGAITITASGSGGTVTGTGTAGQLPYWSSTNGLAGNPNFIWDNTNKIAKIGEGLTLANVDAYNNAVMSTTPVLSAIGTLNDATEQTLLRLKRVHNHGSSYAGLFDFVSTGGSSNFAHLDIRVNTPDNTNFINLLSLENTNGGEVGINNASPTEKLDVNGNVKFSGALKPNNLAGSVGQYLTSQGGSLAPTWTSFTAPTITLTGAVTGSGSGTFTTTLADAAVTYAKMQNITTGKLLGSVSASSAAPGEVTIGTGLSLSTSGVLSSSGGTLSSFGAIAATSNANGATISGSSIYLTPADATNGGVITTGVQTFAGSKTFSGTITSPLYASTPLALTPVSGTITWTPVSGLNAGVTLAANSTLAFGATPPAGTTGTLIVTQPASGGPFTLTLPSVSGKSNKVLGSTSTTNITLSSTVSARDIVSFYYDGNDFYWNVGLGYGLAQSVAASSLVGGATGSMPYQSAANTTAFLAAGTNGQVLTLSGGLPTWAADGGVSTLTYTSATSYANGGLISGTSLTLAAADATNPGLISTGAQTIAGAKTFNADLVVNSIKVGKGAGQISSNVVVGQYSLESNSTGAYNNVLGQYSLRNNTTGSINTAFGYNVLNANTVSDGNSAFGHQALSLVTGAYNTGVGARALQNSTTGGENTALGYNALWNNGTGTQNTAIGSGATVSSSNLTNATAIGYAASATASNTIQLGNASVTAVNTSGAINAPIYSSTPFALTAGATITWTPLLGLNASVTLNANSTLAFGATPPVGTTGTLVVKQPATGGPYTLALPSSTTNKVLGSSSGINLSTTNNATDVVTFYYDGTTCYWNVGLGYGVTQSISATGLAGGTAGAIPYQSGAGATAFTAAGTAGQILTSGGTGSPAWITTLPIANGGTGQTTYATGDIIYASAANTLSKLAAGTNGNILTLASGVPSWVAPSYVDLTNAQTIAGVKTFSAASTIVNNNLTVNAAGTTAQGITFSDDGDLVDNNDGFETFRITGGVKINNGKGAAGTATSITLASGGNITATGSITAAGIKLTTGATNGYVLTSAADGTASWAAATGGITGSGTQNYLPKYNNAAGTTLGNSVIKDDGTTVTLESNRTFTGANASVNNTGVVAATTAYTLVQADNGKVIYCANTAAATITIPSGLTAGFNCMIVQMAAGSVTIAQGASTTVYNRSNYTKTGGQYAVVTVVSPASNVYITGGDMQ